MQGRVYSCRNALQFFTIPLGFFVGGILVDEIFEPLMSKSGGSLSVLFGTGKGSGAAFLFFCIGVIGAAVCVVFWLALRKYRWSDDKGTE